MFYKRSFFLPAICFFTLFSFFTTIHCFPDNDMRGHFARTETKEIIEQFLDATEYPSGRSRDIRILSQRGTVIHYIIAGAEHACKIPH